MNTQPKKYKMPGKDRAHRDAVIRSQLLELIRNEKLQTTPTKAKILKAEFDKLITKAKKNTDASRRLVHSILRNDKAVTKLYDKILPRLEDVNSGYTHSARTLPRSGDNAAQMIVLVRGAEVKQKRSRLQAALKRTKKEDQPEEDSKPNVKQRVQDIAQKATPGLSGKKIDSTADTRRVST